MNNTGIFAKGDTASGIAAKNNISPADFLKYNPELKATGHPSDYQGLTGLVQEGQTYRLAPSTGPTIISTDVIHNEAGKNNADLNSYLTSLKNNNTTTTPPINQNNSVGTQDVQPTDPILDSLTRLGNNSDIATKNLIATTMAKYQNERNKVNTQYDDYKRGLQELGIQHNEAESTPDLLAGHIQQATNDQMSKIHDLDAEESKAVVDAKNAQDNNDFKTLQDKMTYLKTIKQDKVNAIKNLYDSLGQQNKASTDEAHDIYDVLQTITPDQQEAVIQAVAKQYNLPVVSLVQALKDEKAKRDATDLKTQNAKSIIDNRNSGGTTTIKDAFQKITPQLTSRKGDDGYVAPEDYIKAREVFRGETGGTFAQFNSEYKDLVNPESYEKVGIKATDSFDNLANAIQGITIGK